MLKSVASLLALPQPQQHQSVAHSSFLPFPNSLKRKRMRTLCKTWGVYPSSSHFGIAEVFLDALIPVGFALLSPLSPPAVTRSLRIQLSRREFPHLSRHRDQSTRLHK